MDKLSRKGFFGMVAGLFAAPAVAKAIPDEPTGGFLIPPGQEEFTARIYEGLATSGDTPISVTKDGKFVLCGPDIVPPGVRSTQTDAVLITRIRHRGNR